MPGRKKIKLLDRYSIGLDPSEPAGIAVWNGMIEHMVELRTKTNDEVMPLILGLLKKYKPVVVIGVEVSVSRHTYPRRKKDGSKEPENVMMRIAHNVGECYRRSKSYVSHLKAFVESQGLNIEVYELRPKYTKLSKTDFMLYSGVPDTARTSDHARDAGMLAIRAYDRWKLEQMIQEENR